METYLDYARRGRNVWWLYLLTIGLALALWFVFDVVVIVGLAFTHLLPPGAAEDLINPAHPVAFFIGNGLVFASLIAALMVVARVLQAKRPGDIVGQWRWSCFWAGLVIWSACLVVGTLVDVAIRPAGFRWSADARTPALVASALVGLGVQTFAEEYVFRGYLTQGLLLATKRPIVAALISGVLFGALHIPNAGHDVAKAVMEACAVTVFGVAASLIAIRTGGIAFTFGMHLVNNLFGAIVVVSAGDVFHGTPGLFTQTTPGLMWWDVVFEALVLVAPLWWTHRRDGMLSIFRGSGSPPARP